MANPFLMTEEEMAEDVPAQEAYANPFLMDTGDDGDDDLPSHTDNPFFDQQAASNPFADLQEASGEPQAAGMQLFIAQEDPATGINTSFFDTTICDGDEGLTTPAAPHAVEINVHSGGEHYSSEDELSRKNVPPRPGPPIAAQHLISTVAGQLDLASHDLLGRIPVTRTPSPVSIRDLHTPSPPPEEANLFDFGDDPVEQIPPPIAAENTAENQTKKAPPARPPPRPNPPPKPEPPSRPPAVPAVAQPAAPPQQQQHDIMDMFGVEEAAIPSRPPPPKSKEDILSLFSSTSPAAQETAAPVQTDLMDDDIPEYNPAAVEPPPAVPVAAIPAEFEAPQEIEIEPVAPPPAVKESPFDSPFEEVAAEPETIPEPQVIMAPVEPPQTTKPRTPSPPQVAPITPAAAVEEEKPVIPVNPFESFMAPTPAPLPAPVVATAPAPAPARPARPPPRPAVPPPSMANNNPSPPKPVEIPMEIDPVPAVAHVPALYQPSVHHPVQAPPVAPVHASGGGGGAAFPQDDAFDAFSAKFNSAQKVEKTNIFLEDPAKDAWGNDSASGFEEAKSGGFDGEEDGFDTFLAMSAPPPSATIPTNVFATEESVPEVPRANPFDNRPEQLSFEKTTPMERSDSLGSPQTPLFDDDVSQPLEDFPRIAIGGTKGWEMQLRQPNKKKITGQRFWKKIHVRLAYQGDNPVIQLLNTPTDKEPFQELPLQASYSVSEISAQQYDQFGKIFTVKLQYIFYKERPGVRPGQVTKAERITSKLSQFAAYAIQGDYQGVKEFGSDLKKLGIPVEHAPQVSELFKIGSMNYEDLKQFSVCVEEALFKLNVHRDRAMSYKMEEVQVTAVDEIYVEQDHEGRVLKQIARVRLFFLGFLSGMPTIELGVNDIWRQGKEVVGRHDIIPVATEEWIRLEGVEFHGCVQQDHYEHSRTIKLQPPDACYIELMRFRVRPPKNRELPLQVKATWCVNGNRVELRVDVLVPGFASRKLGQIPCEDVAIRFPIPECWIYLFRVEKHFRYGSVKSAHRRTGKIKGIERILGTVDQVQESLIEVTSGQAKYEHHHRAIVWRCPRLPKDGQGAYTTHQMICRMALTSFDQIPEQLAPYCYVEFTMPATQVSHTTCRSVSIQDSDSDDPPEKYVRYLARHEYRVGIEHTTGETVNSYLAATSVNKKPIQEEPEPAPITSNVAPPSESDSDSN